MIDVKLTASDFELELYVDSYEFPDFNTGRDAASRAHDEAAPAQRERSGRPSRSAR